ncbi:hypothetical protein NA78x_005827 [Anatilimnocola sp. NA78]|uniref:hypothetical protein n=1 Tax=Anatilimnocola sp. NA78 TaxID=3415683 RepID=UPI003CE46186
MYRSRLVKIAVCCLALVALGVSLGAYEIRPSSSVGKDEVQLAARYHLRTRTPDFYARAKQNGSRK